MVRFEPDQLVTLDAWIAEHPEASPISTVLTIEEEAIVVAFRKHTLPRPRSLRTTASGSG